MRAVGFLLVLLAGGPALAGEPGAAQALAAAQAALQSGDYPTAAAKVERLVQVRITAADKAEAWRIYGLALYHMGRLAEAEEALLSYLKLEPDARLDPVLVAPEAVAFFEGVRARHEAVILSRRPKKRNKWLNFLPPAGQFQNGDTAKGWILAASETLLLATNIATYVMLEASCGSDRTCDIGADTARTLQLVNILSGIAFAGAVTYGVLDGFFTHHALTRQEAAGRTSVGFVPQPGGGSVHFTLTF